MVFNHFNNFVDTRKNTRDQMHQLKGMIEDILIFQESYPNATYIIKRMDPFGKDCVMQSCDKCS